MDKRVEEHIKLIEEEYDLWIDATGAIHDSYYINEGKWGEVTRFKEGLRMGLELSLESTIKVKE